MSAVHYQQRVSMINVHILQNTDIPKYELSIPTMQYDLSYCGYPAYLQ